MPRPATTYAFGTRRLEVVIGSISELDEHVDVLVSSDDNHLTHGGGVSRALWHGAGPQLDDWVRDNEQSLSLGEVVSSPAFDLRATYLLHAVTIDFDQNRRVGPADVERLYAHVLDIVAWGHQATSLALPLLGAGVGRVTPAASVHALVRALRERRHVDDGLSTVVLVVLPADAALVEPIVAEGANAHPPLLGLEHLVATVLASGDVVPTTVLERIRAGGDFSPPMRLEFVLLALVEALRERANATLSGSSLAEIAESCSGVLRVEGGALRPTPAPRQATLRANLDCVTLLSAHIAHSVPESALTAAVDAVEQRNRVMHAHALPQEEELAAGIILNAVEELGRALSDLLPADARERAAAAFRVASPAPLPGDARPDSVDSRTAVHPWLPALSFTGLGESDVRWAADELILKCSDHTSVYGAVEPETASPPPSVTAGGPEPEPGGFEPKRRRARRKANRVEHDRVTAPGGTSHVRKLRDLLLRELDADALAELQVNLERRGFKGEPRDRLLEFCVTIDDPIALLADEFAATKLRALVARDGGDSTGKSARELASTLLESLGFPRNDVPRGLARVTTELRWMAREAQLAEAHELTGLVVNAGKQLEFVVEVLLRFVCLAAWKQPPEQFFTDRGQLDPGENLRKKSLGSLLYLLEHVSQAVETDASEVVAAFRSDVGTRLAPSDTGNITALRNQFAHFDGSSKRPKPEDLRLACADFFTHALAFLDHLGRKESRVYPFVVRVDRISVDRWRRRVVVAMSDEGFLERIFTDEPLQPGDLYFMHPLTNPLRVDPILIPAGELGGGGSAQT